MTFYRLLHHCSPQNYYLYSRSLVYHPSWQIVLLVMKIKLMLTIIVPCHHPLRYTPKATWDARERHKWRPDPFAKDRVKQWRVHYHDDWLYSLFDHAQHHCHGSSIGEFLPRPWLWWQQRRIPCPGSSRLGELVVVLEYFFSAISLRWKSTSFSIKPWCYDLTMETKSNENKYTRQQPQEESQVYCGWVSRF